MRCRTLTERQLRTGAEMVRDGYSAAAVAARLGISRARANRLFPQGVKGQMPARLRRSK